jgi:ribose-phosphate pyrophosphokinase
VIPLIFAQSSLSQSACFLAPDRLATEFLKKLNGEVANYEIRSFPDGETYLRVLSDCLNRDIIILANLHQPNSKLVPLIFLCEVLKEMGCNKITLIAPYLPYMRQDIQFHAGEAVTSRFFAKLISQHVDLLITIDPHLHRYHSLSQIYTCDTRVLQANPVIAEWIKLNIEKPFIVGPDSESEQWAANVANMVGCPYLILEKQRFGDADVKVSAESAENYKGLTPVLIDDIISTGRTMTETAKWLSNKELSPPICIGVHALFSGDALQALQEANIEKVLTCSTITHDTNEIDISNLLITAYKQSQTNS